MGIQKVAHSLIGGAAEVLSPMQKPHKLGAGYVDKPLAPTQGAREVLSPMPGKRVTFGVYGVQHGAPRQKPIMIGDSYNDRPPALTEGAKRVFSPKIDKGPKLGENSATPGTERFN